MTRMHSTTVAALLLSLPLAASAQTPAAAKAPTVDAKTPGDCVKGLNDWRVAQMTPAATAVRSASPEARDSAVSIYQRVYATVNAEAVRSAKECAAKFSVEKTPTSQLSDLVSLYTFIGDTANRRRASERALAAADLSPRQHGQTLLDALGQEIGAARDHFGILDGAEHVAKQIDALPDSLADLKLSAHQTLLGRYEYLDVNEGLRVHATALIALGRRLGKPGAMIMGFESLARSAADPPATRFRARDSRWRRERARCGADDRALRRFPKSLRADRHQGPAGDRHLVAQLRHVDVTDTTGRRQGASRRVHRALVCALQEQLPRPSRVGGALQGTGIRGRDGDGAVRLPRAPAPVVARAGSGGRSRVLHRSTHFRSASPSARARPAIRSRPWMPPIASVAFRRSSSSIVRGRFDRSSGPGWDQGNTKRIGDYVEHLLKQPVASER